jgi:hypothetical protein
MTKKQVALLKKLIYARLSDVPVGHLSDDWRMVEVGWINGVDPRTARSLVNLGLAVECMPSSATQYTNTHLRLPESEELS